MSRGKNTATKILFIPQQVEEHLLQRQYAAEEALDEGAQEADDKVEASARAVTNFSCRKHVNAFNLHAMYGHSLLTCSRELREAGSRSHRRKQASKQVRSVLLRKEKKPRYPGVSKIRLT